MGEERATYTAPAAPAEADAEPAEPEKIRHLRPLGSITGYAQDVDENVDAAAVSEALRKLLHEARRRAFFTAGYQQRSPDPRLQAEAGIWCEYDNAAWAQKLHIDRKYLWRLRVRAEELGFFTYHPDPADSSHGRLRWNLDFNTWTALSDDYRRARYSRDGAGRPKSNAIRSTAENKSNVIRPVGDKDEPNKSNVIRPVGENKSNVIRTPATAQIKRDTPACSEAGQEAARGGALRKEREEERGDEERSSAATAQAPTPRGASQARPRARKLTDEQLEAKRIEEDYIAAIFRGIEEMTEAPIIARGQERDAAHKFYRYQATSGAAPAPVPVEDVLECYRLTLLDPYFATTALSLQTLLVKRYGIYRRSPAGYASAMQQKADQAARQVRSGAPSNGHQRETHPGRPRPAAIARWRERP